MRKRNSNRKTNEAVTLSTAEQQSCTEALEEGDAETIPYAHNWLFLHAPLKSGSTGQESIMQRLTAGFLFAKALTVPRELQREHLTISY